eukprot:3940613-Rhodomonas_salina.3
MPNEAPSNGSRPAICAPTVLTTYFVVGYHTKGWTRLGCARMVQGVVFAVDQARREAPAPERMRQSNPRLASPSAYAVAMRCPYMMLPGRLLAIMGPSGSGKVCLRIY